MRRSDRKRAPSQRLQEADETGEIKCLKDYGAVAYSAGAPIAPTDASKVGHNSFCLMAADSRHVTTSNPFPTSTEQNNAEAAGHHHNSWPNLVQSSNCNDATSTGTLTVTYGSNPASCQLPLVTSSQLLTSEQMTPSSNLPVTCEAVAANDGKFSDSLSKNTKCPLLQMQPTGYAKQIPALQKQKPLYVMPMLQVSNLACSFVGHKLECGLCYRVFSSAVEFVVHKILKHPHLDRQQAAFTCPECGKLCSTIENLEIHCQSEHCPFLETCSTCSVAYLSKQRLSSHTCVPSFKKGKISMKLLTVLRRKILRRFARPSFDAARKFSAIQSQLIHKKLRSLKNKPSRVNPSHASNGLYDGHRDAASTLLNTERPKACCELEKPASPTLQPPPLLSTTIGSRPESIVLTPFPLLDNDQSISSEANIFNDAIQLPDTIEDLTALYANNKTHINVPLPMSFSMMSGKGASSLSVVQREQFSSNNNLYQVGSLNGADLPGEKMSSRRKNVSCVCTLCKMAFFSSQGMRKHRKQFSTHRKFQCQKCFADILACRKVLPHVRQTKLALDCPFCAEKLWSDCSLYLHVTEHHVSDACIACDRAESFVSEEKMISHLQEVHRVLRTVKILDVNKNFYLPYLCIKCDVKLTRMKARSHLTTRTSAASSTAACAVRCLVCGFGAIRSAYQLDRHRQIGSRIQCIYCRQQCDSECQLSNHITEQHEGRRRVCPCCDRRFACSVELFRHWRKVHGNPLICNLCYRTFDYRDAYKDHMDTHEGRVILCDVCGRSYKSKVSLYFHKYSAHRKRGTFECKFCGQDFSYHVRLRNHTQLQHRLVNDSVCTLCPYTSPTGLDALAAHLKLKHSLSLEEFRSEKLQVKAAEPHLPCPVCGKLFFYPSNVRKHAKLHYVKKLLCCSQCKKSFQCERDKSDHEKSCTTHSAFYTNGCVNPRSETPPASSASKETISDVVKSMESIPKEIGAINGGLDFDQGHLLLPADAKTTHSDGQSNAAVEDTFSGGDNVKLVHALQQVILDNGEVAFLMKDTQQLLMGTDDSGHVMHYVVEKECDLQKSLENLGNTLEVGQEEPLQVLYMSDVGVPTNSRDDDRNQVHDTPAVSSSTFGNPDDTVCVGSKDTFGYPHAAKAEGEAIESVRAELDMMGKVMLKANSHF